LKLVIVCAVATLALSTALADEVTDALQEGMAHYRDGRLSAAVDSLELATGLIRREIGDLMKAALPSPLKGWQVDEALSSVMAAGFYGGGISAQRVYREAEKLVMLRYVTDSVVLQSAMLAFDDPAFATANGGSFKKIGRERSLVKYDAKDKSGEIAMVLNKRILISVRGTQVGPDDLAAYAAAVDLDRLARLP
jgi:hypothetical protein